MKKLYEKNQGPNSNDDKVKSLLSPFRNRHRDIVTYRGHVSNQKGSPRVDHWMIAFKKLRT